MAGALLFLFHFKVPQISSLLKSFATSGSLFTNGTRSEGYARWLVYLLRGFGLLRALHSEEGHR
jgi:hypothetical protein